MDRLVTREELRLQQLKFNKEIGELRKKNAELYNALAEARRQQDKGYIKVAVEPYCEGCMSLRLKTRVVIQADAYGQDQTMLIHKCKHADFCEMIAEQVEQSQQASPSISTSRN